MKNTQQIKTVVIEVLQTGSPEFALALAEVTAADLNPGYKAVASQFSYAHPAHGRGMRWVGIDVDLTIDPTKTLPH